MSMHPENIRQTLADPTWKERLTREQLIDHLERSWRALLWQADEAKRKAVR